MWTELLDKTGFVSEISTLEANKALVCPTLNCDRPIILKDPIRDREGDIIKWAQRCPRCGRFLIIYND
jgi:hypothetical protein